MNDPSTMQVFMLIDDSTVRRYKSDLIDEVEPVISELLEKSEQGLKTLNRKENHLQIKVGIISCISIVLLTDGFVA